MTDTTARPLTIDGPAAFVASIPHLVGFTPTRSDVVAWIADGFVVLTQRADAGGDPAGLLAHGLAALHRNGETPDAVAVALYRDALDPAATAMTAGAYIDAAEALDLHPLDVLTITADRWRSSLCINPECCPADGKPIDHADPLAVELIGEGSAPLPSRDAIAEQVTPTPDALPVVEPSTDPATWDGLARDVFGHLTNGSDMAPDVVAGAFTAMRVRDVILWEVTQVPALDLRPVLDRLLVAARSTAEGPHRAPVLTACGITAWLAGDGARAAVYIAAALAADEAYSLAILVHQAVATGLPAQAWRESMAGLTRDKCLNGVR